MASPPLDDDDARPAEQENVIQDESHDSQSNYSRLKIANDLIFGFITWKPYIVDIIDTVEFQRLRWIWHLGATPFVYPTANHTRFEHSISAYHIASKLITKIKNQLDNENSEIKITESDVKCVEIAALCHDIGRGPFSDVWDNLIVPNCSSDSSVRPHYSYFSDIWQKLKGYPKINDMLKRENLVEEHENMIVKLVEGKEIFGKEIFGKEILHNIVRNVESGIDVCKLDSLARDSTCLGHASTNYRVEIDRMIHFARAIKNGKGVWEIAFRETEYLNIIRVFQLRHHLHQTAYQHRTVIAIEMMLLDGFIEYFNQKPLETPGWILKHNDTIFWSNVDNISVFKRILTRDLYRPIFEATKSQLYPFELEKLKNYLTEQNCNITKVRFRFTTFKLGNTNMNPILSIPFFTEESINEIFYYEEETTPLLFTAYESKLVVFSTLARDDHGENERNIKEKIASYFKELDREATKKSEKWTFHDIK